MRPSGSLPVTTACADNTGVMPSSCSAIFSAQPVASRAPTPCSSEGSLWVSGREANGREPDPITGGDGG